MLSDGPHQLQKPSFYALQHMAENGFNISTGIDLNDPRCLSAAIAALLSDSEPTGDDGEPVRVWTPTQAAKLIPLEMQKMQEIAQRISELLGGEDSGEGVAE
jgi:hypothetical protein